MRTMTYIVDWGSGGRGAQARYNALEACMHYACTTHAALSGATTFGPPPLPSPCLRQQRQRQRRSAAVAPGGKQRGKQFCALLGSQAALQQRAQLLWHGVGAWVGAQASGPVGGCVVMPAGLDGVGTSSSDLSRRGDASAPAQLCPDPNTHIRDVQPAPRIHSSTHLQLAAGEQDEVEGLHHGASKPGVLLLLATASKGGRRREGECGGVLCASKTSKPCLSSSCRRARTGQRKHSSWWKLRGDRSS